MNPNNNILSIDALFQSIQEETSVATDAPGNWPAMDKLLERFLPVLKASQESAWCVQGDENEVYLS